jgi:hypothetical protein
MSGHYSMLRDQLLSNQRKVEIPVQADQMDKLMQMADDILRGKHQQEERLERLRS